MSAANDTLGSVSISAGSCTRSQPRGRGCRAASATLPSSISFSSRRPVSASSSHTPSSSPIPRLKIALEEPDRAGASFELAWRPQQLCRCGAERECRPNAGRGALAVELEGQDLSVVLAQRIAPVDHRRQQSLAVTRRLRFGLREAIGGEEQAPGAQLGGEVIGDGLFDRSADAVGNHPRCLSSRGRQRTPRR